MMFRLVLSFFVVLCPALMSGQETADNATQTCPCANNITNNPNEILLAGLFDTSSFHWGAEIFEFTVHAINEGMMDMVSVPPSAKVRYNIADSKCDEATAARAYWKIRTLNGGIPMHGIVGCRCSGASVSVARIAELEGVPQVSPISTSSRLSNTEEFPYFSRMVAPDDERGEVGALVAMLRLFDWSRVSILSTNTPFAKDVESEFRKLWSRENSDASGDWEGKVAYSNTIALNADSTVDEESVRQALKGLLEPDINSRVVLLIAHDNHAYNILSISEDAGLPPDTIWIGLSSWVARAPLNVDPSWKPKQGYIGLANYFNRDPVYEEYLKNLKEWQASNGRQVYDDLPSFIVGYMVDAIVALTMVLFDAPLALRRNASYITNTVQSLVFNGVSGRVQFTSEGDRKNPKFSIVNMQDGEWVVVGSTSNTLGTASFSTLGISDVCFAEVGCGLDEAPDDSYPVPEDKLPAWLFVIIAIPVVAFVLMAWKYKRSRKSKLKIKEELTAFRDSVVGMRAAEKDYIPSIRWGDEEQPIELPKKLAIKPMTKIQWCWKETASCMHQHDPANIVDFSDCWIKYNDEANNKLEAAYNEGKPKFSPMDGYIVDFGSMTQTKVATGFKREVQRLVQESVSDQDNERQEIDVSEAQIGDLLPKDLQNEPQMVLVKGDIVQISKQRNDGWAFGTKLHHNDEVVARELVSLATQGVPEDSANVFPDTGWFQLSCTRVPTGDDLTALRNNVGDAGELDAPAYWEPVKDPTVVQLHELQVGNSERDAVVKSFLNTLDANTKIIKVQRIQNLAMWQSFVVKRQTICYREMKDVDMNSADAEAIKRNAMVRFERKWLWHGTNYEVMDKILQQGFNRSFCGKNATMYGKGVYFARDASYSACTVYAQPDRSGLQYVLACRVIVGEYCRGKKDALTPDIRDAKSHSLFDSTVDNTAAPSLFVTYHDAQAYPEYLIVFKR